MIMTFVLWNYLALQKSCKSCSEVIINMLKKSFVLSPDKELVIKIINGDKDAFKDLYQKYYYLLIQFAWYRTNSMETSRDLVQDVFCKIWLARKKLDPKKSIKAYLYKSVGNAVINVYKLHSSGNTVLDDNYPDKISNESDQEFVFDMRNAISNLPEKIKTVFTLSRYDGFSYEEIAEICEVSVKTVEKRMSNAFKKLRKIFHKNYYQ